MDNFIPEPGEETKGPPLKQRAQLYNVGVWSKSDLLRWIDGELKFFEPLLDAGIPVG